nr:hypothetical protein [Tanacetum cinerariifolium]
MSTQQDIYAASSESRPPMLNKEKYMPWSSCLLRYAISRPNGKLIHNSIINGPYVRRMILEPGDTNREVPVNETFHVQTDDDLTEKEFKQIEADDQAIQTILLGLPEDIYAAVDSCETAQEICGVGHFAKSCTVRPRRRDAAYLQTQLLIAQKEEAGIQLQAEEFDLMAAAADLDEIEEVNANYILMANLQQASTSGTQSDEAPIYDSDGSAEVHNYENYDDNEIFNMFTQEEQYTELLEPISEPHQVPQNDNNVIFEVTSMEQSEEIVEQHPANFEETHALYDSLYQNLAIELEKVNSVNRKLKETNADLTTELARFKNQEKCFKINQEKYNKLERCYQYSVYQEQCLSKKINALHLSSGQLIQTIHMLSPKPDSFYHTEQKMAFGYQNPFYLKQAHKKQESLYDGNVLLENHDPPVVHDSEETLQLAQESRENIKQLNKEIKPANNTKINHLSREAAKFVGDFESLAKEADDSLAKHKPLELEIERLLRAVVSQDIMSVVQKASLVDTSNLQT